jgi:hypothetical protein
VWGPIHNRRPHLQHTQESTSIPRYWGLRSTAMWGPFHQTVTKGSDTQPTSLHGQANFPTKDKRVVAPNATASEPAHLGMQPSMHSPSGCRIQQSNSRLPFVFLFSEQKWLPTRVTQKRTPLTVNTSHLLCRTTDR